VPFSVWDVSSFLFPKIPVIFRKELTLYKREHMRCVVYSVCMWEYGSDKGIVRDAWFHRKHNVNKPSSQVKPKSNEISDDCSCWCRSLSRLKLFLLDLSVATFRNALLVVFICSDIKIIHTPVRTAGLCDVWNHTQKNTSYWKPKSYCYWKTKKLTEKK